MQIKKLNLGEIKEVGNFFLGYNQSLEEANFTNLRIVGVGFILRNKISLIKLDMPRLIDAGTDFLYSNKSLKELSLPELSGIRAWFLSYNDELKNKIAKELYFRNLK